MNENLDLGDDHEFTAEVAKDPLKALKRCRADYAKNDLGHHENRWKLIGRAVIVKHKLRKSAANIGSFLAEELSSDRKYKTNPKYLLLYCMQILVRAKNSESPRYKTASDYAKAAAILLADGIEPKRIFSELKKRGGIYKILKQAKKAAQGSDNGEDDGGSLGPDIDETVDKGSDGQNSPEVPSQEPPATDATKDGAADAATPSTDSAPKTPAPKRVRIFDATKDIAIAGKDFQSSMLDVQSRERRWVLLQWGEDDGDVRRIEVIDMKMVNEMRVRST